MSTPQLSRLTRLLAFQDVWRRNLAAATAMQAQAVQGPSLDHEIQNLQSGGERDSVTCANSLSFRSIPHPYEIEIHHYFSPALFVSRNNPPVLLRIHVSAFNLQ